jgi:hypothetical protein
MQSACKESGTGQMPAKRKVYHLLYGVRGSGLRQSEVYPGTPTLQEEERVGLVEGQEEAGAGSRLCVCTLLGLLPGSCSLGPGPSDLPPRGGGRKEEALVSQPRGPRGLSRNGSWPFLSAGIIAMYTPHGSKL